MGSIWAKRSIDAGGAEVGRAARPDGADRGAGEEGDDRLGDVRQVGDDAVAAARPRARAGRRRSAATWARSSPQVSSSSSRSSEACRIAGLGVVLAGEDVLGVVEAGRRGTSARPASRARRARSSGRRRPAPRRSPRSTPRSRRGRRPTTARAPRSRRSSSPRSARSQRMNSVRRERSTSSAEGSQSGSGVAALTPSRSRRRRLRLLALELVRVVGAEEGDLVAVVRGELAQRAPGWRLAGAVVGGEEALEDVQPRRAAGRRLDLAVVEVGVAAVQQPAVAAVDGAIPVWPREWPISGISATSTSRPGRMRTLSKPNQRRRRPRSGARPSAGRASSGRGGSGLVRAGGVQRCRQLGREDVDLGGGEVGQAAGVVGVEVGDDDLAHVGGGEAERLDLRQRRLLDRGRGAEAGAEDRPQLGGVARVLACRSRCRPGPVRRSSRSAGSGRPCGPSRAARPRRRSGAPREGTASRS